MEALSRRGHEVKVVDFSSSGKPESIADNFRLKTFSRANRTDPQGGVELVRPGVISVTGVARASAMLPQFVAIFKQALNWSDVIVLYSVPTNGLQTILSSKLTGKPVLFHSFDVLHRMTGHSFLTPPTWAMERLVYSNVDKIVVISAALLQYMERIGVPRSKISLLPPAVNIERFNPSISGEEFRREIGLDKIDKVALFSGWLYEFSGLDLIMNSMKDILVDIPEFKLVICGDGPLLKKLQSLKGQLDLKDSVKLVGRREFEAMPEIVASADVCLNPYLPEVRSNFAFPSKIAEYMATGKPVIATDLPGTRSFLGSESGAVLVTPQEFVVSLKKLMMDKEARSEIGKISRKYCESYFSLGSITSRFEEMLYGLRKS